MQDKGWEISHKTTKKKNGPREYLEKGKSQKMVDLT